MRTNREKLAARVDTGGGREFERCFDCCSKCALFTSNLLRFKLNGDVRADQHELEVIWTERTDALFTTVQCDVAQPASEPWTVNLVESSWSVNPF
jgi:hypothetical protein